MAVKPAITKTPERTTTQYTVGDPTKTLDVSTASTAPNLGSLIANPNQMTLVGADVQSGTAAVGALATGASQAFSIRIPFPNIPTPFVVGTTDDAWFIVNTVYITHGIAHLVIGQWTIQPQSYTKRGTAVFGSTEHLQVSQTFTGWAALVSGNLVAQAASAAGTLTVRVSAALYDILG